MKSITYARLTLLTPYPILVVSILGFIYSYYSLKAGHIPGIVGIISILILYTSVLWFIPYTILAIGLLIWSIRKSFQQFRIAYIGSPILLAALLSLFFIVVGVTAPVMGETNMIPEVAMIIFTASMLAIPVIIIGYFFVGLSLLFHKALFNLKVFRD